MTFGKKCWKAISFTPLPFADGEIEVRVLSWLQGQ